MCSRMVTMHTSREQCYLYKLLTIHSWRDILLLSQTLLPLKTCLWPAFIPFTHHIVEYLFFLLKACGLQQGSSIKLIKGIQMKTKSLSFGVNFAQLRL